MNVSGTASPADSCALLASNGLSFDWDHAYFHVDGNDQTTVNLELVTRFTVSPAQVGLYCGDGGVGDVWANAIRITAVQVAELTYTVDPLR